MEKPKLRYLPSPARVNDYLPTAKENEQVFRSILRDLKQNRLERKMGLYVPQDLDTEGSIDSIFEKYSKGDRTSKFTICDFAMQSQKIATLFFENVSNSEIGGAELEYEVLDDNSVVYSRPLFSFKS